MEVEDAKELVRDLCRVEQVFVVFFQEEGGECDFACRLQEVGEEVAEDALRAEPYPEVFVSLR